GAAMSLLMGGLLRLFVSREDEARGREHAQYADAGHQDHTAGGQMSLRERLTSTAAWTDVAQNFRGDWRMLWKEITIGFLLAGFVAQLGDDFFNGLFITDAPSAVRTIENAIAGPVIAV